jgi:hypothetical protein
VPELPASGQWVLLWWRKRRLVCGESSAGVVVEAMAAVPRGSRLTARLRAKLAEAIAGLNRPRSLLPSGRRGTRRTRRW